MRCVPVHGDSPRGNYLGVAAMPSSQGFSSPRDQTLISCIDKWALTTSAFWEVQEAV